MKIKDLIQLLMTYPKDSELQTLNLVFSKSEIQYLITKTDSRLHKKKW
jgi:hypothetical protein